MKAEPSDFHRFFPFGVECVHCRSWVRIGMYVNHVKVHHSDCRMCRNDGMLAEGMLEQIQESADQVSDIVARLAREI